MSIENETNEIVVDRVDVEGHGFRGPEVPLGDAGGDVEGHGFKGPEGTLGDAGGDVEGHGFRGPEGTFGDAGGDVEGHGFRGPEVPLDDAEGHWLPASAYEREGGRSRRARGNGGDDVEGHVNFRPLDRSQGA